MFAAVKFKRLERVGYMEKDEKALKPLQEIDDSKLDAVSGGMKHGCDDYIITFNYDGDDNGIEVETAYAENLDTAFNILKKYTNKLDR